jgi:hypothetical protein
VVKLCILRTGEHFWGNVKTGVPIRVEIGMKEIKENILTLSTRNKPEKEKIYIER